MEHRTNISYTLDDMRRAFDDGAYRRGFAYARSGQVRELTWSTDGSLSAQVQGNGKRPYRVQATPIAGPRGHVMFDTDCSCPVGMDCKHVVAALVQGMHREPVAASVIHTPKIIEAVYEPVPPVMTVSVAEPVRLDWQMQEWLRKMEALRAPSRDERALQQSKRMVYLLDAPKERPGFSLQCVPCALHKDGLRLPSRKPLRPDEGEGSNAPKYLLEEDIRLLRRARALMLDRYGYVAQVESLSIPDREGAEELLQQLLATGRAHWKSPNSAPLALADTRHGAIGWRLDADGTQHVQLEVEGLADAVTLSLSPPYYIDVKNAQAGKVETGLPAAQVALMLQAPPVRAHELEAVRSGLAKSAASFPNLAPAPLTQRKVEMPCAPHLRLLGVELTGGIAHRYSLPGETLIASAELSFDYGGRRIKSGDKADQKLSLCRNGEMLLFTRDFNTEAVALKTLRQHGFYLQLHNLARHYPYIPHASREHYTLGKLHPELHRDPDVERAWVAFVNDAVPALREAGWIVEMDKDFPYRLVMANDDWYAEIGEGSGIDWFGLELGVTMEGERLNLLPILLAMLKAHPNPQTLTTSDPDGLLLAPLPDGRKLALPHARARALLKTLHELYSYQTLDESGLLRLQTLEAHLLAEIEAATGALNLRWFGGEKLRALGQRLKQVQGVAEVLPPASFQAELRPYQQQGLNWLQFLREYKLAGILADDMGLGKTVQALAHIATEKAAGRLSAPFLVIAPTSLMANWRMEAERFTPDLRLLTLHGPKRKAHFGQIMAHDVVLTTYPLLPRDKEALLACNYHTVLLDEAQTIKNARTKLTQIVCQIKADHRLCMTGTPLENHLGELWSLFNFLLPGYLGDDKKFRALFRNPIEKDGEVAPAHALARRVKPFILRRTKQEVATELPPKTEMLRMVELEGAQRDIYETIRVSMHEKVRAEIAAHGLAKSHIIVLDALLKLRQACCDPRLLKLTAAKKAAHSAKLDELMDMLPPMIEEGRKVLLFSQFTSMLSLIEERLREAAIPYALLTGSTKDRETPIRAFQQGNIPLFLISLKAGGVGLNLTSADTVIHYDPWWNPAVENQATDRAYRIGQDKPVFVYKLIAQGTVEEKILEMQARKRKLADSLFDPASKSTGALSAADIQALFEPLAPADSRASEAA